MIHNRKQFLRNSAAIVCGNALYSLSVAAFLEPGSSPAVPRASRWP